MLVRQHFVQWTFHSPKLFQIMILFFSTDIIFLLLIKKNPVFKTWFEKKRCPVKTLVFLNYFLNISSGANFIEAISMTVLHSWYLIYFMWDNSSEWKNVILAGDKCWLTLSYIILFLYRYFLFKLLKNDMLST